VYRVPEHRKRGLGGTHHLSRCPSCLKPIAIYDEWIEVNGSFVHANCARQGEYEETPSPGWAAAEELARRKAS
jgi:hypothetical protein